MSEKTETQSAPTTDWTPTKAEPANATTSGGGANAVVVAKVEALLKSSHTANPGLVAKIIHDHPGAKADIMMSVHKIRGNEYAHWILDLAQRDDEIAENEAYNKDHAKDKGFKKRRTSPGYVKTTAEGTGAALTRVAAKGNLNLTKGQIWQLDQISSIETGGKAAAVDTTDDEVVSIGFDQLVLGSLSIQRIMEKVPAPFKKHGLELHPSEKYHFKSNPRQIVGAEHQEFLRTHEWGDKFLAASAEDEVLAAMAEYAIQKDQAKTIDIEKKDGATNSFWGDDTARAWITEVYNSRPSFTDPTIQAAINAGADAAKTREAFLDILSKAIISESARLEPLNALRIAKEAYTQAHGKKSAMPAADQAAWLATHAAHYTQVGTDKATHIVTKIPRDLNAGPADGGDHKHAKPKPAAPAPAAGGHAHPVATVPHETPAAPTTNAEHHDAAPAPVVAPAHPDAATHHEVAQAPLTPAPAPTMRVKASALHLRSSPAEHADNLVATLRHHDVVEATAASGAWIQVRHGHHHGFVFGEFVEPVAAAAPAHHDQPAPAHHQARASHPATPHHAAPAPTATTAAPPHHEAPQVAAAPVVLPPAPTHPAHHDPAPAQAPAHAAAEAPARAPHVDAPNVEAAPKPADNQLPAPHAELHGAYKGIYSHVYSTGSQRAQVWVSEGGVSSTPNVYLHFHGHRTNYGIDPDLTWDASKHAPKEDAALVDKGGSGHRAAQQAMAAALNKNTVVIMPQGVEGEGSGGRHEGGYMADLEALGLDGFLKKVMGPLGKDLGVDPLTAGHIGLGGHSSGGYEGMHSALRRLKGEDKDIADHITDITLYDANYGSGAHLDETLAWAIKGSPNKNVRLVNGWGQTTTNKKINQTSHDLWFNRFGEAALAHYAKAHGMTVRPVAGAGDRLDKETSVVQHSQIINKDGAVQCDVLILMFSSSSGADHEALRDREIDDAIMSIGEGAAGNATFGHHDKGKLELQNQLKEEHAELKKDQQDHKLQGEPAHPAPDQQVQPPPEHQDGAHAGTHEIAKPATATGSVAAPLEHARKVHKKQEALFDKLYNEKSGDARLSNLGHHSTTTVKEADPQHPGKKIKKTVDINLTDEQYKFKQRVFVKAVERAGDGLFGGVPKDKLDPIAGSDGQHIRKEVTSDLNAMIAAAKAEVGVTLTVASGYRDIKEEMGLWNHAFDTIYLWMEHKTREAMFPGDPYGDAAAAWLAEKIASRKAVPGTSNHSNGIAVDLTGPGLDIGYDNQTGWRGSSVYKWLNGLGEFQGRGAAKRFNFQNYHKEAWHYDWRGKLDE